MQVKKRGRKEIFLLAPSLRISVKLFLLIPISPRHELDADPTHRAARRPAN